MDTEHERKEQSEPREHEAPTWTTPGGAALPRVLDRAVTMDLVQRYVESERVQSRRVMLLAGTFFIFFTLLILTVFSAVGVFVLRNARKSTAVISEMKAQTASYAVEVIGISNKLSAIELGQEKVGNFLADIEDRRSRQSGLLQKDLSRFAKWVASSDAKREEAGAILQARLDAMEKVLAARDRDLADLRQRYAILVGVAGGGGQASGSDLAKSAVRRESFPDRVADAVAGDSETQREVGAGLLKQPNSSVASNALAFGERPLPERPPADIIPESIKESFDTSQGVSVVTFPNGDRYEGQFKDGLFQGWGVYYYRNGSRYEGEFRRDMKHGKGTFTDRNGDRYVGEFRNDMREGRGQLLYSNGDKYSGEFANDLLNGRGLLVLANGNRYEGDFRGGKRHGNGVLFYRNGDVYRGDFFEGVIHGKGSYVFSDGSKYIGDFDNGRRHGKGQYIYLGGEEYLGDFRNGEKDGVGVCVYPNGLKFSGLWSSGKFVRRVD